MNEYLKRSLECYAGLKNEFSALDAAVNDETLSVDLLRTLRTSLESAYPQVCVSEHRFNMRSWEVQLDVYGKALGLPVLYSANGAVQPERIISISQLPENLRK